MVQIVPIAQCSWILYTGKTLLQFAEIQFNKKTLNTIWKVIFYEKLAMYTISEAH